MVTGSQLKLTIYHTVWIFNDSVINSICKS